MVILINAVANIIITLAGIVFMIFIFKSDKIHTLPSYEQLFIKVGLATLICGSLFNFLTLTTPPISESLLNCGLAMILLWGAWFHYKHLK